MFRVRDTASTASGNRAETKMAGIITTDTAAKIWQALTRELRKPGAEGQRKMAAAAMAGDTSTDHIESKAIIAKVSVAVVKCEKRRQQSCP